MLFDKYKHIYVVMVFIVPVTISFASYAEENNISRLVDIMQHTLKDDTIYQQALYQGEQRVMLCQYCHGKNGISIKDTVPNLAAQNSEYLLRQFELFANNSRKDRIMSELAKNLSPSDKVNVALYYASQKAGPGKYYAAGSQQQGKALFVQLCASCHGNNGHGKQALPRIAGQPPAYLIKTLRLYKNGSLVRPDSPMRIVAARLSDDDINSLTSYISSMH